MTQPTQPSSEQFQAFQQLVSANTHLLRANERHTAWEMFKTQGAEPATSYVQGLIESASRTHVELRGSPLPYPVWGAEFIESQAMTQMTGAMRLPISAAGALMPDAHMGYGLPIGGVLATDNAVIPYAVGVDIACRMMLTLYAVDPAVLDMPNAPEYALLKTALVENTVFGSGGDGLHDGNIEHNLLDESKWNATPLIKSLRQTAIYQIGTSGTGNHFVEWGSVDVASDDNPLGVKAGRYLALLSHSGSRGVGYKIADYYSKLAMSQMPTLDESVKHLAWLSLDGGAGAEYWDAMHLAGEFASANHHVIHERVARGAGLTRIAAVENHHNFAWKETHIIDGEAREVIVHRKGATPAGKGVMGIIPGTMADKGYIVVGKGVNAALASASHGSGRAMSRSKAKQSISLDEQAARLTARGVELIGGGLDEAPQAYKPIDSVIGAQAELIDVIGTFQPRIVRMATDAPMSWRKPVPQGVVENEGD